MIQFGSERNPGFWITIKFSLTLLSMGHKGNRCQTEYSAGTVYGHFITRQLITRQLITDI